MAEKYRAILIVPVLMMFLYFSGCDKPEVKNESASTKKDTALNTSASPKNNITETRKDELSGNFLRPVSSSAASSYIGQRVLVKGKVAQIVKGSKVTFLNIDSKFPKNKFCAVIFSDKQKLFSRIEEYEGKEVEIEGVVSKYKDKAEIILNDPLMIRPAQ